MTVFEKGGGECTASHVQPHPGSVLRAALQSLHLP